MKILIKSLRDALAFIPNDNTYAIRIHDSKIYCDYSTLQQSSQYLFIRDYTFDAIDYHDEVSNCAIAIDDSISKQIITDFQKGLHCSTLLIHCRYGENRSPSVAMALNDIFNLGDNSHLIALNYPRYVRYVYQKIMDSASDI